MNSVFCLSLVTILLVNINWTESIIFLVDPYMNKMVELSGNNQPCKIHYDRKFMQNTMKKYDPKSIQKVNPQVLNDVSKSCTDSEHKNTGGFIFPGTKWCGPGNIASRYTDLGIYEIEDRCCREHDHCPNHLEPGQCRNGICNVSPFTSSHCDCDQAFRKCLLNANTDVASVIGSIYFNIAQRTCFRERRFCPQGMRDNLSYSWFCAEWKFTPSERYVSPRTQVLDPETKIKNLDEPSKINIDLEQIFGNDEDVSKIMNKSNT
ncbi:hypothetical protein RUM43_010099 [Polyplax serrata]|uniref:Phospholipase A2 n=1 Tax=Polyplax serrata TaxID=468196 RepID=A0AAN8NZV6_POLSC